MNIRSSAFVSTASEWLPEPPAHWQVKPFRHCFRPSDERNGETPIGEMLSVSGYRGVVVKDYEFEEQKRTAEELETYRVVRPGQLAVNTMWLNYTGLGVSEHLGYVSPAYRSYWIKSGLHGRFVHHLLRSSVYVAGYTSLLQGIRPNSLQVPTDAFHSIPILVPPLEEQQIIAAYLDRETGRIDALVERLERLIALLTEKRQAVISHAVTKGLNPDAPMKNSGIDWLGEVPAHWAVEKLGWRYEVQLGRMLNAERAQGDNLRPYLRVADVQWREIRTDDLPLMDFPPDAQSRYRLKPGDLLVNEGGSYVGRSAIWNGPIEECYYQKALHRVRPLNAKVDDAEFLLNIMEAATTRGIFVAGGNQTTIDHLTAEQLRAYRFAFPPLEEQQEIAAALNKQLGSFEAAAHQARSFMDAAKERRSALISAAVTGQVPIAEMTPDTQPEDAA